MERIALSKALERLSGRLTTIHPDENITRRVICMQIAEMRILHERLDHLAGYVQTFHHKGELFCRQLIPRTEQIYWYKAVQGNWFLIEKTHNLENYYEHKFSSY